METVDRKSELCAQAPRRLTGMDFVQVTDPKQQTVLRVFFIVDPGNMQPPLVALATIPNEGDIVPASLNIELKSLDGSPAPTIIGQNWLNVAAPAGTRIALEITVDQAGSFVLYDLILSTSAPDRIDRFFNCVRFSFKQGCTSLFDCKSTPSFSDAVAANPQIDYLARDFHSFNKALLDFAERTSPNWGEALEADQLVMLKEVMAYLGDEFAYIQDRYAREATLETATQRVSRKALSALVDYDIDPGAAAEGEVIVFAANGSGGQTAAMGSHAWAAISGQQPVAFISAADAWIHPVWNELRLHLPDPACPWLLRGATEAYLVFNTPVLPSQINNLPLSNFIKGRRAVLSAHYEAAEGDVEPWPITIVSAETVSDPLVTTNNLPTELLHITWEEPLQQDMPLSNLLDENHSVVHLNILPVIAGAQVVEEFGVGIEGPSGIRATEREGIYSNGPGTRGRVIRCGLEASTGSSFGWHDDASPRISVTTYDPGQPAQTTDWQYFPDILASDLNDNAYTLEPGNWSRLVTHRNLQGDVHFSDYASNDGWTVRFGDGDFGNAPESGLVVRVTYFTGPGSSANLPAGAISKLTHPGGQTGFQLFSNIDHIENLLPITGGRDEETANDICINAPLAFRYDLRRAVRPEDYSEIIEKQDGIQRAFSTTCWTGSWSTDFVSADPLGGYKLSEEQSVALDREVNCIRQATRDARVVDAEYVNIDIAVEVCVCEDSYAGEVIPAVYMALGPTGLLSPDNFTFAQGLARSAIEATVQSVPGVCAVKHIRIRERGIRYWRTFTEPEFKVGIGQIIRLENNPDYPGRGVLKVTAAAEVPA